MSGMPFMKLINGEYMIELNGIKHWVKIEGIENNTVPLIIIHGGPGGNHYTFERTAGPLLSKTRTIVYYEQRGCGRTHKPTSDDDYTIELLIEDFKELKRWLGVEKVDLLGYSFGGELALEFSYAFPKEINKIILSGPSLMRSEIQKMVQIAGFFSVGNFELRKNISEFLQNYFSLEDIYEKVWNFVDTETVDSFLFENKRIAHKNRQLWKESKLINTGLMMRCIQNSCNGSPLESRIKYIKQKALIIAGVYDRNTGLPISTLIHKELPNSQLILFEKSAHFPDLEETDKFVNVILEFLDNRRFNEGSPFLLN